MIQSLQIGEDEANILEAASTLGFGELLNVTLADNCGPGKTRDLSDAQIRFVQLIRRLKVHSIHKITVHNNEPVMIEIGGVLCGIECLQKLKV